MGVEPYLITSTIECFIAQRLVRLICPRCKHPVKDSAEVVKEFSAEFKENSDVVIYEGKGCESCKFTGYSGRQAIYEFLVLNEEIRQLIMERATANRIKDKAVQSGMKTLNQAGWEKVQAGLTTPQEVLRVIQDEE